YLGSDVTGNAGFCGQDSGTGNVWPVLNNVMEQYTSTFDGGAGSRNDSIVPLSSANPGDLPHAVADHRDAVVHTRMLANDCFVHGLIFPNITKAWAASMSQPQSPAPTSNGIAPVLLVRSSYSRDITVPDGTQMAPGQS